MLKDLISEVEKSRGAQPTQRESRGVKEEVKIQSPEEERQREEEEKQRMEIELLIK